MAKGTLGTCRNVGEREWKARQDPCRSDATHPAKDASHEQQGARTLRRYEVQRQRANSSLATTWVDVSWCLGR